MLRITVAVRDDGRIVILRVIRDELDLEYGDLVELAITPVAETGEDE